MSTLPAEAQYLSDSGIVVANPSPELGDYSLTSRRAALRLTVPWEMAHSRWFRPALEQLSTLLTLPPNWDSYGGRPTAQGCAEQAISFLARALPAGVAPPWVVPLGDGGLQLEWHRGGIDVEVALSPDDGQHLWLADSAAGVEWEGALDDEGLSRFQGVIDRLAAA